MHSDTSSRLPTPDPQALEHVRRVTGRIHEEIRSAGGRITFARYMALALYEPGLGYYSAGASKFGRAGDYVTAPELSSLFSRCVARQCAQVLAAGGRDILEFGAGTGAMARDIMTALAAAGRPPDNYFILEVSAELRRRQRETLEQGCPGQMARVHWLDRLPVGDFTGVVLANEVLDAFPVHRFQVKQDGEAGECFVRRSGAGFDWETGSPSSAELREAVAAVDRDVGLAALGPGYTSEVCLLLPGWLLGIAGVLRRGAVLLFDYGYPRREYYHPQRRDGTLACHYRHHRHADPFVYPGLQDITAHVDFTAVAQAAQAAGLDVAGYTNQANFLLATDLHEAASGASDGTARGTFEVAQQIKVLTLPQEMGELIKVMALTRGVDYPLQGFSLRDYRGRL
jgi:SAM-dependent MidA family methyltransferase